MLIASQRLRRFFAYSAALPLLLMTHPALASLPKPPDGWYAENGNWFKAAKTIGNTAVKCGLIFLTIALIITVLSGMLRGYRIAQERQEMSHFFKAISVGLLCLTLGSGLLYGAHIVIQP